MHGTADRRKAEDHADRTGAACLYALDGAAALRQHDDERLPEVYLEPLSSPTETTLIGSLAAIAFALPVLRNALPGSPPLGVEADMWVFLWAELAARACALGVQMGESRSPSLAPLS